MVFILLVVRYREDERAGFFIPRNFEAGEFWFRQ